MTLWKQIVMHLCVLAGMAVGVYLPVKIAKLFAGQQLLVISLLLALPFALLMRPAWRWIGKRHPDHVPYRPSLLFGPAPPNSRKSFGAVDSLCIFIVGISGGAIVLIFMLIMELICPGFIESLPD